MAKVSVLVPIYNVEKYLRECLQSLVGQTLEDIEIICINDGSKDSSLEIIKEFANSDKRIKIIDKENTGYGNSMNRGLELAQGEYIGIVESDDFVDSNMFYDLYKIAKENDADIVKSDFYNYVTSTKTSRKSGRIKKDKAGFIFNIKDYVDILKLRPAIWSSIYRREFLDNKNIRFLETEGASYQDVSFNFKALSAANKIYLTTNAYLHYRNDNPNSSVKQQNKVFAITKEYDEITCWLDSNQELKKIVNTRKLLNQYDNYCWNLQRIEDKFKEEFLDKFRETFCKFYSNDEIKEDFYNEVDRSEFESLLNDKKAFKKHFEKKVRAKKWHDIRAKLISIRINASRVSIVLFGKQIVSLNF